MGIHAWFVKYTIAIRQVVRASLRLPGALGAIGRYFPGAGGSASVTGHLAGCTFGSGANTDILITSGNTLTAYQAAAMSVEYLAKISDMVGPFMF